MFPHVSFHLLLKIRFNQAERDRLKSIKNLSAKRQRFNNFNLYPLLGKGGKRLFFTEGGDFSEAPAVKVVTVLYSL